MKFKNILGILITVGLIIAVSGCTSQSSNNSTNNSSQYQIKLGNTPVITQNPETGEYLVDGLLQNTGNTDYKNVQILVIGLDENGTKISEKKALIATIKANDYASYDVTLPKTSKSVAAADIQVLDATTA